MKNKRRRRYTMIGKTVAFILLLLGVICIVAGVTGTYYMAVEGFYVVSTELIRERLSRWINLSEASGLLNWILDNSDTLEIVVPTIAVCGLIVAISSFVYLMCAAGWKKGEEEVTAGLFGKVPTDLFLAVTILLGVGWVGCVDGNPGLRRYPEAVTICPILFLLLMNLLISIAARAKAGTLWTNTVIYRLWKWIVKGARIFADIFVQTPLIWKTICCISVVSLIELLVMCGVVDGYTLRGLLLLWFLEKLLLVPFICFVMLKLKKLLEAGNKLAEGNLNYKVSTKDMFWDMKEHGEALNRISDGVTKAVNERMKSERFKTELITNVSHDIKTPLTSIINYSDLLNKEETDNEKIKEYGDVLYRQSTRLKKLIEDLVEASKASTGSIEVNLTPCEVGVLLEQTIGEFEQKLYERDIDIICKQPETPVNIMADGRHLWRVFDNLMNNICKYAQRGTRVYLNVEADEDRVFITFKNISEYPLDISADELMERFVRGDRSRHTEGSGLGLSIAKSLVELQNGSLDLSIDGDLFKVLITFPVIK